MENRIQCSPAELEQTMKDYGTMVYRLAYSQTRSTADAEDIYQDVFLRYFQKRPRFESEQHRRAWLLRVTLNRARSLFSSAWFRTTVPLSECVEFQQPDLVDEESNEKMGLHGCYYSHDDGTCQSGYSEHTFDISPEEMEDYTIRIDYRYWIRPECEVTFQFTEDEVIPE